MVLLELIVDELIVGLRRPDTLVMTRRVEPTGSAHVVSRHPAARRRSSSLARRGALAFPQRSPDGRAAAVLPPVTWEEPP